MRQLSAPGSLRQKYEWPKLSELGLHCFNPSPSFITQQHCVQLCFPVACRFHSNEEIQDTFGTVNDADLAIQCLQIAWHIASCHLCRCVSSRAGCCSTSKLLSMSQNGEEECCQARSPSNKAFRPFPIVSFKLAYDPMSTFHHDLTYLPVSKTSIRSMFYLIQLNVRLKIYLTFTLLKSILTTSAALCAFVLQLSLLTEVADISQSEMGSIRSTSTQPIF